MADAELAAIRNRRMAEMQAQANDPEQQAKKQEIIKREEEMRNAILSQVLNQAARARLNSIALVKPEKAKAVESLLVSMAQKGQLSSKLGEEQLVGLLEKVNQQTSKASKVTIERRRYTLDSDED